MQDARPMIALLTSAGRRDRAAPRPPPRPACRRSRSRRSARAAAACAISVAASTPSRLGAEPRLGAGIAQAAAFDRPRLHHLHGAVVVGICWRRSARRSMRRPHRHAAFHRRHRRRFDDAAQDLLAQQQRVGRDPALAAGPALDVGRIERHLAEPLHHAHKLGLLRHRQAQHTHRADDQLDRRLDQRRRGWRDRGTPATRTAPAAAA